MVWVKRMWVINVGVSGPGVVKRALEKFAEPALMW